MNLLDIATTWGGHLVGIIAALVGAFALFKGGKYIGSAETESRLTEKHATEAVEAAAKSVDEIVIVVEEVSHVTTEVVSLAPGDAAKRLRDDWNINH